MPCVHLRTDMPERIDLHINPEALAQAKIGMRNVVESPEGTGANQSMMDLPLPPRPAPPTPLRCGKR